MSSTDSQHGVARGSVSQCSTDTEHCHVQQWWHVLQVRSQYQMCKQLRVPFLSYPRTLQLALEQGPVMLRGLSRYAG